MNEMILLIAPSVSVNVSSCRLYIWPKRIEDHEPYRRPVACGSAPALGICSASALIELVTFREDVVFTATMALIGRHEPDCAVPMFPVVPTDEPFHPSLGGLSVGERQPRVCGCVL